ncbi:hypothetical protein ZHAS_00019872 [Anopheles sinensis]|uniref:Uncharacterized protein n=1 Tax=Anopheles sinensis TaxID=74873 RepID=A0A084WMF3_ANOSI|nr:hypothetical protein ZHAS_00019872 [Anopheles sinensis]
MVAHQRTREPSTSAKKKKRKNNTTTTSDGRINIHCMRDGCGVAVGERKKCHSWHWHVCSSNAVRCALHRKPHEGMGQVKGKVGRLADKQEVYHSFARLRPEGCLAGFGL